MHMHGTAPHMHTHRAHAYSISLSLLLNPHPDTAAVQTIIEAHTHTHTRTNSQLANDFCPVLYPCNNWSAFTRPKNGHLMGCVNIKCIGWRPELSSLFLDFIGDPAQEPCSLSDSCLSHLLQLCQELGVDVLLRPNRLLGLSVGSCWNSKSFFPSPPRPHCRLHP